jgi:hypothetical protein
MSSRADFYIGRGQDMRWLGSIAMDGYPDQFLRPQNPERREWDLLSRDMQAHVERPAYYLDLPFNENPLVLAQTPDEFLTAVMEIIDSRDDGTPAELGWPWPWNSSAGSRFVYAFDEGELWVSQSGGPWYQPQKGQTCQRWAVYETLCDAEHELREIAGRVQRGQLSAEADEVQAAKAEVAQARAAYEAFECPAFPDMSAVKNVSRGARSGATFIARGGAFTSANED